MKKPQKKYPLPKMYDWHEVETYIQKKYKRELRNWAGHEFTGRPDDPPYQDIWHYIVDGSDVHNGSSFYLQFEDPYIPDGSEWVREVLDIIQKEFAPGECSSGSSGNP